MMQVEFSLLLACIFSFSSSLFDTVAQRFEIFSYCFSDMKILYVAAAQLHVRLNNYIDQ